MTTSSTLTGSARLDVLLVGSLTSTGGKVVSTCSLIQDGDCRIVVDPGMAERQADILDPLRALGVAPESVTEVVLSHHHPDHTLNAALFPSAAVHDFWAIYRGAAWEDSDAEGRELSPSVHLIHTPGHTPQDISTVVATAERVVVCTHLWWTAEIPIEDPVATDPAALHASRERVLALADMIVPGHGAPFAPTAETPR